MYQHFQGKTISSDKFAETLRLADILVTGCKTHRAYRALRKPLVTNCDCCSKMWEARQLLK